MFSRDYDEKYTLEYKVQPDMFILKEIIGNFLSRVYREDDSATFYDKMVKVSETELIAYLHDTIMIAAYLHENVHEPSMKFKQLRSLSKKLCVPAGWNQFYNSVARREFRDFTLDPKVDSDKLVVGEDFKPLGYSDSEIEFIKKDRKIPFLYMNVEQLWHVSEMLHRLDSVTGFTVLDRQIDPSQEYTESDAILAVLVQQSDRTFTVKGMTRDLDDRAGYIAAVVGFTLPQKDLILYPTFLTADNRSAAEFQVSDVSNHDDSEANKDAAYEDKKKTRQFNRTMGKSKKRPTRNIPKQE